VIRGRRGIGTTFVVGGLAIGLAAALSAAGCGGFRAAPSRRSNATTYGSQPASAPAPAATSAAPAPAAPPVNGPATLIKRQIPNMGSVVTDAGGHVLYRFDKDTSKPPMTTCAGDCAKVWPPVLTLGIPVVQGIDPTLVDTVVRPDGTMQVTLNGWPMYSYLGDPKPLAWKGQGVAGTWWAFAPDGRKNLTCVPTATPKAVPPPPDPTPTGDSGY
jgi:predicted lipoprotein with Yx(FWY)xxD motif